MTRRELVDLANTVGDASRSRGAPRLTEASGPDTVARWLQWCDPNGCHTPDQGFEPYDDAGAWEALASMLADA